MYGQEATFIAAGRLAKAIVDEVTAAEKSAPLVRDQAMKAAFLHVDRSAIAGTVNYLLYLGSVLLVIVLMVSGGGR